MKMLSCCVFGFALAAGTVCFAQIDIYQSDAYSLEEMCAREAEQTPVDYTGAYESCIEKNKDNPMYQSGPDGAAEDSASDGAGQTETHQNESEQDSSQDQMNYFR